MFLALLLTEILVLAGLDQSTANCMANDGSGLGNANKTLYDVLPSQWMQARSNDHLIDWMHALAFVQASLSPFPMTKPASLACRWKPGATILEPS